MAGTIVSDVLQDGAGNSTATTNAIKGSAKAWVNFSCPATTVTINNSFNVSSVTRNGTGDYSVTFTTAMPSIYYSVAASSSPNNGSAARTITQMFTSGVGTATTAPTTTGFRFIVNNYPNAGTNFDPDYAMATVFSS
jgi:hypothetical protein